MNKVIASMLIIIVIISAVIFGTAIYKKSIANNENIESKKNTKVADEEIVDDECTQEWENLNETSKEELLQANSSEEKISPNCKVVLKEKYLKCNDETENKISEILIENNIKYEMRTRIINVYNIYKKLILCIIIFKFSNTSSTSSKYFI